MVYVRAAVEELPAELAGVADQLTIILPWGSLLAAVVGPSADLLKSVRALCAAGATLEVVVSVDPARDHAERARLGIPSLDEGQGLITSVYATAAFRVTSLRRLDSHELAHWPSTWARRLAHGRPRPVLHIVARALSG